MYYTKAFRYREDLMQEVNRWESVAELVTVIPERIRYTLWFWAVVRTKAASFGMQNAGWKTR